MSSKKQLAELKFKEAKEITDAALLELGQKVYEDNIENKDSKYADLIAKVDECIKTKTLWHLYGLSLDGKTLCENCGAIITSDSVFCNKCGGSIAPRDFSSLKVEESQPVETSAVRNCPSCGSPLGEGALFCEKCGASIANAGSSAVAPQPAANACPSCGEPLVPGAMFCEKCGKKL